MRLKTQLFQGFCSLKVVASLKIYHGFCSPCARFLKNSRAEVNNHTLLATFRQSFSEKESHAKSSTTSEMLGCAWCERCDTRYNNSRSERYIDIMSTCLGDDSSLVRVFENLQSIKRESIYSVEQDHDKMF